MPRAFPAGITLIALVVSIAALFFFLHTINTLNVPREISAFLIYAGTFIAALGRSPLPSRLKKEASIIMESQTILKQIELAGVTYAESYLENNKAAIVADLQGAGVKAVDFLEGQITTAIGKGSGILGKLGAPTLKSIVSNVATQTIAGLGGEEAALYALVDGEMHALGKSLGGA